jgi:hypothetical protein
VIGCSTARVPQHNLAVLKASGNNVWQRSVVLERRDIARSAEHVLQLVMDRVDEAPHKHERVFHAACNLDALLKWHTIFRAHGDHATGVGVPVDVADGALVAVLLACEGLVLCNGALALVFWDGTLIVEAAELIVEQVEALVLLHGVVAQGLDCAKEVKHVVRGELMLCFIRTKLARRGLHRGWFGVRVAHLHLIAASGLA